MQTFASIDRNPSLRTLASLALTFAVAAAVIGFELRSRGQGELALRVWAGGGLAAVLALVPPIGRWLYVGWMGFGIALGTVTSPIVLGVLYLVLFVPVALVFRVTGRDLLGLKKAPRDSYWEPYPEADDPARYVKQY